MSLSYTTGNPNNLTAGAAASMGDIQGPFTDIKTFLTDGSGAITDGMLTSSPLGVWRTVATSFGAMVALGTTPAYFSTNGLTTGGSLTAMGMWSPPAAADIAVTSKTTRLRLRVPYATNATAPAITFTWGLYPVTTGGGAGLLTLTLGTVVAGSTASVASPSANTGGVATGSSFDSSVLTAGNLYVLGVVGSGTQAANSNVGCQFNLEMRHT